jgi:hypothetical protein
MKIEDATFPLCPVHTCENYSTGPFKPAIRQLNSPALGKENRLRVYENEAPNTGLDQEIWRHKGLENITCS